MTMLPETLDLAQYSPGSDRTGLEQGDEEVMEKRHENDFENNGDGNGNLRLRGVILPGLV
jgi:hypothetical protein